jgi:hypothetical protein
MQKNSKNKERAPYGVNAPDFSSRSPFLNNCSQILKVVVSCVSSFVSAVCMGSPLVFGGICPRICALFGCGSLNKCQYLPLLLSFPSSLPALTKRRLAGLLRAKHMGKSAARRNAAHAAAPRFGLQSTHAHLHNLLVIQIHI